MSKISNLRNFLAELPDFVYDYIETAYQGDSINTQLGYSIDIKIFLQYLKLYKFRDVENLEDFTVEHMEQLKVNDFMKFQAYLKEYETEYVSLSGKTVKRIRTNSAHGINRKMSGIRGLFRHLYKHDLISRDETEKIDFKKLHQKMKKPLNSTDTMNFLDYLYNGENHLTGRMLTEYNKNKLRDIAIFTAYLGTGCRVSELVNLNMDDIYFETSSFIVTRKGGDQQEIFMPVQVENAIAEYMEHVRNEAENAKDENALFLSRNGTRLTAQSVEKAMRKYCIMAGITDPERMHPHALRRTFACNLIADGIDIKMVAELMGHKNIEVTHRYYTQYAARKRKEVMKNYDIKKDRDKD